MSDNKEQALPFFARYLEEQFCEDLSEEEMSEVQGGAIYSFTKKYPSDHEEGDCITSKFKDDIAVTLKYPSDNEDGGAVTEKYPSDTDEFAVTHKYPSDGDDHIGSIDIADFEIS
ncbi:MAG: microviridin/marinostatin family tricyclic proteinase inhibitor [Nostocaceae cyanobacterium]|nr:microviridin/marinostatin family tricyclic proteinase inhibitor [Nostocaceae cyanobacterium]